jgi:antitoxin ParD1/3/4
MTTLSPKQEQLIQSQLSTGRYANAEEVLELALQLLTHLDSESQEWLEKTRQKIAAGIAELDRSEGVDGATVMNQFLERFQSSTQSDQQSTAS